MRSTAAQRGHEVTLFEADDRLGGQFNYAAQIPGQRGNSTRRCGTTGWPWPTRVSKVELGRRVGVDDLSDFDEVVLATGVTHAFQMYPE